MADDGKSLEALVAFVEEKLLPSGFKVTPRKKVMNDEGVQIAEFDVDIRGKVGSTDFSWLIECRDRKGAQGGEWIEQLVGRRMRFPFNKITAVSTSGFTSGAHEFAARSGIELREVRSLSPEAFDDWLQLRFMEEINQRAELQDAGIFVNRSIKPEQFKAVQEIIAAEPRRPFLKSSKTGVVSEPSMAFLGLVQANGWFNGMVPDGPNKAVEVMANYTDDGDHFLIETPSGDVRVDSIAFKGFLSVTKNLVRLTTRAEYVNTADKTQISRYAAFEPIQVNGTPVAIEFHRLESTCETHVVARVLEKKKS